MFTGLIKEVGIVRSIQTNSTGKKLEIECPHLRPDIAVDDSVATNGICLTATEMTERGFVTQAVHTTVEKTTLKHWKTGDQVNLELALRLADRLGGHIVSGHINSIGKVTQITNRGDNRLVKLTVTDPEHREMLEKFIMDEGSIAIDGTSLTVSKKYPSKKYQPEFEVSIIPHTWDETVFRNYRVGSQVNLEFDLLAKMVFNLLPPSVR